MARTIQDLINADARLSRTFVAYLLAVVSAVAWSSFLSGRSVDVSGGLLAASLALGTVQMCLYVWFAVSASAGARALGRRSWHYIVWILAAPFMALAPLPVVSTVVAVSPLIIKFLVGGQLQTAIRDQTSMALHVSA